MITTRTITVDIAFHGSGHVVEKAPGQFHGGVVDPNLDGLEFQMWHQVADVDGGTHPTESVAGAIQVSIRGSSAAYRELAQYLLGVAELNTDADPDFHEHHELTSADGHTMLHLIVRKTDERAA